MSGAAIRLEGETISFTGELNLHTVPDALRQFEEAAQQVNGEAVLLDLQGISRSDSTGVALLVECLRQMRLQNKTVRFSHLPKQMQEMARVSGLLHLLQGREKDDNVQS